MPWLILLLGGLGFLGFGIAYTLFPARMGDFTDVGPSTSTARADFMATYGGLQVGFGVFLLACARAADWLEPGLWAATACLTGLASVRTLGIALGRARVRWSIWFGLALETVGAGLSAWGLSLA